MAVEAVDNRLVIFHVSQHQLQKWIKIPAFINKEVKAREQS